jgi:hypothetical protein
MIIQNANIQFSHAHTLTEAFTQSERLLVETPETTGSTTDTLSLSATQESGLNIARSNSEEAAQLQNSENTIEQDELLTLDAKTLNLKTLVESFIGREITLSSIQTEEAIEQSNNNANPNNSSLLFQYSESYFESETSLFSATGNVLLASGETLNIDFSQYSERSFYEEINFELRVGEPEVVDPLVVNINGTNLTLTPNRYAFDLNDDGTEENIAFATGGSAFLALDKNQNGTIDNGSELFGALTGNGYAELAQYDEDGNQFIDSSDSVFANLQLLRKNADGSDSLTSVKGAGIGAFYLGNNQTPFQIKDNNNDLQALVRRSSVFLREDGTNGSTQQIDLVI